VPVVHGHAGAAPPHAWQLCEVPSHVFPGPQSAFVVQPSGAPPSAPGGTHVPPEPHTVPWGHSDVCPHCCWQPEVVHTDPAGQLALPVHVFAGGGVTVLQP
jgi:hypothetical protein